MPCNVQSQSNALNDIFRARNALKQAGFVDSDPAMQILKSARQRMQGIVGFKVPRLTDLLKIIAGLSPGSLELFYDSEGGWLVQAREKPGALPVQHYVDDATAVRILNEDIDHELEERLMRPDPYMGE